MTGGTEKPVTPPPVITGNDRVLLHYAILTDSVGFTSGHSLMYVGDKEIGRVPYLAICEDKDSLQFVLYFCNRDWGPIGVASYDSVETAKRRAERIYPGSANCWVGAHFSEADAKGYIEKRLSYMRCSFCGKTPDENQSVTFTGSGAARICSDCVRKLHSDLSELGE